MEKQPYKPQEAAKQLTYLNTDPHGWIQQVLKLVEEHEVWHIDERIDLIRVLDTRPGQSGHKSIYLQRFGITVSLYVESTYQLRIGDTKAVTRMAILQPVIADGIAELQWKLVPGAERDFCDRWIIMNRYHIEDLVLMTEMLRKKGI
jgi:hypothetical protein